MSDISNKQRLLQLRKILMNETDEQRSLTLGGHSGLSLNEIIDKLKLAFKSIDANYKVGKRAIRGDIAALNDTGFSICDDIGKGGEKYYYHQEPFEIHELRMLIDAVCSARFITKADTEKIMKKIKKLTSENLAKKLQNQIHIDDMVKSEDNMIKVSIDKLHSAISGKNEISFQYGNYNVKKEFVLHHNEEYYFVRPHGLVWNNDYYYLVGHDTQRGKIINFRVDRMRNVEIDGVSHFISHFDMAKHLSECFLMFPGEPELVEIQFVNQLVNVIIDRFGKDVTILKADEKTFVIKIRAAINLGLIRWILTWGSDAKVLYPQSLAAKVKDESEKMYKQY